MNKSRSLMPIAFVLAVIAVFILFAAAVLSGSADFGGLIVIGFIPIAFGSSSEMTVIAMIAGLLLVIAYFLFYMWFRRSMKEGYETDEQRPAEVRPEPDGRVKTDVKGGGVIMIGPIPIIFGSDSKYTSLAIALAIILMLLALVIMLAR